ncbi:MAG: hypothetical protein MUE65_01675 [Methanomassiliicoccales archaeon]|jgi:hypothetical protein|nr:hypothetical protein [Methanomassiliicoccales archaeon]
MPQATIVAKCFPTEDPEKVRRAILNIFPGSQPEHSAEEVRAITQDLSRFKELIRNHRILDSTRRVLLRGSDGQRTEFALNKQAAHAGKVSFLEEKVALGGLQVRIEDEDLEALIDQVAPVTVNGEEVPT